MNLNSKNVNYTSGLWVFVWTAESEWHDSFLLSPSVVDTRWETDLYSRSTRLRNYCCSRLPTHTKITTLIRVNLLSGACLRLLNTYSKRRHLNQRSSKTLLPYTGIFCHFRGFNIFSGLFGHVQSVVDWHPWFFYFNCCICTDRSFEIL